MNFLVLTTITKLYRVFPVAIKQKCVVCGRTRSFCWMWKFRRLRKGFIEPGVKHACLSCTSADPGIPGSAWKTSSAITADLVIF